MKADRTLYRTVRRAWVAEIVTWDGTYKQLHRVRVQTLAGERTDYPVQLDDGRIAWDGFNMPVDAHTVAKRAFLRLRGLGLNRATYQNRITTYARALGNEDWNTQNMLESTLPSGSGLDSGCPLIEATEDTIRIGCDFHAMNGHGYYVGWLYLAARFTLSAQGWELTEVEHVDKDHNMAIEKSGADVEGIVEYLEEVFDHWANEPA